MKKCQNCGSINRDDAKFCMHCGSPLQLQKSSSVKKPNEKRGFLWHQYMLVMGCVFVILGIVVVAALKARKQDDIYATVVETEAKNKKEKSQKSALENRTESARNIQMPEKTELKLPTRVNITTSGGDITFTYTYDANGNPVSLKHLTYSGKLTTRTYTGNKSVDNACDDNGRPVNVFERIYNDRGILLALTQHYYRYEDNGEKVEAARYFYGYDDSGNLVYIEVRNAQDGLITQNERSYDAQNRYMGSKNLITGEIEEVTSYQESADKTQVRMITTYGDFESESYIDYTYDQNGMLISEKVSGNDNDDWYIIRRSEDGQGVLEEDADGVQQVVRRDGQNIYVQRGNDADSRKLELDSQNNIVAITAENIKVDVEYQRFEISDASKREFLYNVILKDLNRILYQYGGMLDIYIELLQLTPKVCG